MWCAVHLKRASFELSSKNFLLLGRKEGEGKPTTTTTSTTTTTTTTTTNNNSNNNKNNKNNKNNNRNDKKEKKKEDDPLRAHTGAVIEKKPVKNAGGYKVIG